MNEINHELWDNIFEPQQYEDIDVATLKKSQEKIKDMVTDFSIMQQDFDYICEKIFGIPPKKPEECISVQNNIASTTRREQLDEQEMMAIDSTPSEIDNEKNKLMNKYLQFDEIMIQDEIIKIKHQISDYWERHHRNAKNVQVALHKEYFTNIISLINNLLQRENEVLKFKIDREKLRTKVKSVELINMSREIDHDKCKLLIDNRYLLFVDMIRQEEIKRIFIQLQTYRNNMPNEEVDLITYKDFIVHRIETIKSILDLRGQVMDFNLQLEREATNVEMNDVETSNMSYNADYLKNTLLKNNKNLRYIAKTHQEEINKVYAELEKYCNDYCPDYCNRVIGNECHLALNICDGADDVEKTNNVLSDIDEEGLTRDNKNLRSSAVACENSFNDIYNQLKMYCGKYDMPNENVTIVMHTEPYDYSRTIINEENKLKKENEYLAFVAIMHLEKLREILFFFEMFRSRFCECTIEKITKTDSFLQQKEYVTNEISFIKKQIAIQRELLNNFAQIN